MLFDKNLRQKNYNRKLIKLKMKAWSSCLLNPHQLTSGSLKQLERYRILLEHFFQESITLKILTQEKL